MTVTLQLQLGRGTTDMKYLTLLMTRIAENRTKRKKEDEGKRRKTSKRKSARKDKEDGDTEKVDKEQRGVLSVECSQK